MFPFNSTSRWLLISKVFANMLECNSDYIKPHLIQHCQLLCIKLTSMLSLKQLTAGDKIFWYRGRLVQSCFVVAQWTQWSMIRKDLLVCVYSFGARPNCNSQLNIIWFGLMLKLSLLQFLHQIWASWTSISSKSYTQVSHITIYNKNLGRVAHKCTAQAVQPWISFRHLV